MKTVVMFWIALTLLCSQVNATSFDSIWTLQIGNGGARCQSEPWRMNDSTWSIAIGTNDGTVRIVTNGEESWRFSGLGRVRAITKAHSGLIVMDNVINLFYGNNFESHERLTPAVSDSFAPRVALPFASDDEAHPMIYVGSFRSIYQRGENSGVDGETGAIYLYSTQDDSVYALNDIGSVRTIIKADPAGDGAGDIYVGTQSSWYIDGMGADFGDVNVNIYRMNSDLQVIDSCSLFRYQGEQSFNQPSASLGDLKLIDRGDEIGRKLYALQTSGDMGYINCKLVELSTDLAIERVLELRVGEARHPSDHLEYLQKFDQGWKDFLLCFGSDSCTIVDIESFTVVEEVALDGGIIATSLADFQHNNWADGFILRGGSLELCEVNGFVSGIQEDKKNIIPHIFSLSAFPNPFNSSTTISYSLPKPGRYALDVVDIQGRLVTRLSDGWKEAGSYREVWDAREVSAGVYQLRFEGCGSIVTTEVLLLK